MDKRTKLDLQKKATQIRKYIIEEVFSAKSGLTALDWKISVSSASV